MMCRPIDSAWRRLCPSIAHVREYNGEYDGTLRITSAVSYGRRGRVKMMRAATITLVTNALCHYS